MLINGNFTYPSTADASAAIVGGHPFASGNSEQSRGGHKVVSDETTLDAYFLSTNASTAVLRTTSNANVTNATMSTNLAYVGGNYLV